MVANGENNGQAGADWWADAAFVQPLTPHRCPPPPSPPGPNNEKIYGPPSGGLLALLPGMPKALTHTDFQECPKAWEHPLVGTSSSPPHEDTQSHGGNGTKHG